jgi:site-specific DNA-methyltransferase (adenine-specific)
VRIAAQFRPKGALRLPKMEYPSFRKMQKRIELPETACTTVDGLGVLYCTDALTFLEAVPTGTASIVFIDPPFNLQKRYGRSGPNGDSTKSEKYLYFMMQILREATRVLAPGGALYLYHLPKWAMLLGGRLSASLDFRHWIAVSMKNGFVRGDRLYPAHYALLFFTKGKPHTFVRPKTPIQLCRHCRKPVKDYGGYKQFVKNGVNVSDIWDEFSPVRHKKKKHRKANELPLALLQRIVAVSGRRKGLLVDPFAGTGPSLVAAVEAGMQFIASDREPSACRIAAARVKTTARSMNRNGHG